MTPSEKYNSILTLLVSLNQAKVELKRLINKDKVNSEKYRPMLDTIDDQINCIDGIQNSKN